MLSLVCKRKENFLEPSPSSPSSAQLLVAGAGRLGFPSAGSVVILAKVMAEGWTDAMGIQESGNGNGDVTPPWRHVLPALFTCYSVTLFACCEAV